MPTIKQKHYVYNPETGDFAYKTEEVPINEDNCTGTDMVYCPHCGDPMSDPWELGPYNDEATITECGACQKEFRVHVRVETSYTTSPPDGWPVAQRESE